MDFEAFDRFSEETATRLDRIEQNLELLLKTGPVNMEVVHALFRDTHSMKSAANLLGLLSVEKMAHKLEDILDAVRNGQDFPDTQLVAILRTGFSRIDQLIQNPHMIPLVDIDRDIAVLARHLQARSKAGKSRL